MKFKRIYIEITNSCNLNCSFCSKSFRDKRNMSILEFETVLKKGKIIESGTHLELLDKRGHYYNLYQLQYEKKN